MAVSFGGLSPFLVRPAKRNLLASLRALFVLGECLNYFSRRRQAFFTRPFPAEHPATPANVRDDHGGGIGLLETNHNIVLTVTPRNRPGLLGLRFRLPSQVSECPPYFFFVVHLRPGYVCLAGRGRVSLMLLAFSLLHRVFYLQSFPEIPLLQVYKPFAELLR